jgi:hypothetical protein
VKSEVDSSSLRKTLLTSFGNIGPSASTVLQTLLEKRFFIKCLCRDCALHARPLEQEGLGNKHTSPIACLVAVFVSGCWGYSLGLFFEYTHHLIIDHTGAICCVGQSWPSRPIDFPIPWGTQQTTPYQPLSNSYTPFH